MLKLNLLLKFFQTLSTKRYQYKCRTQLKKLESFAEKVPDCMVCKCLETITQMKDCLGPLMGLAEYSMPNPSHQGPCGSPDSSCDGVCVDRSNLAYLLSNSRRLYNEICEED